MERREWIAGILAAAGMTAFGCENKRETSTAALPQLPVDGVPSIQELQSEARKIGLVMSDRDLIPIQNFIGNNLKAATAVAQKSDVRRPLKYARASAVRPPSSENPLNAWYVKAPIKGAETGPLRGKTIAIKDNICVAGIPMMNGSRVMEGFIPETDATIVERLLDAGVEVAGKAVCESFCLSFGSHTADTGFVLNPLDRSRTTGGSSSGSAALVAANAVDFAIGCDQGGSIRVPAAFCGIAGLKPTWGLVPYTGIFPLEPTIDHTGPIARTVYDLALVMEVIAGPDGLDPRQSAGLNSKPYRQLLAGRAKGLRVGVLKEGFGLQGAEADADALVRESVQKFERAGATVKNVSVEEHALAFMCWLVVIASGFGAIARDAMGTGAKGRYTTDMAEFYSMHRRERSSSFPPILKMLLIQNSVFHRRDGLDYGRSQNLARAIRDAYDNVLREVDVLAMPTAPLRPPKLPPADADFGTALAATQVPVNTAHFDLTGHPALTVPCGKLDGLPIGMQIVGRIGDDATVLRAGHVFEQVT